MMSLEYYNKYLNKKFNKLTFIKFVGYGKPDNRNKRRGLAKFKCDCGKEDIYIIRYVIKGEKISCGCQNKRQYNKNWTGYGEISGDKWYDYIRGAKDRGLEFNITIQQTWEMFIKQNRKCALSGLELTFYPESSASLDRIDSTKGYTIDNVQWIHKDINLMKNHFNQDYFVKICKFIANKR